MSPTRPLDSKYVMRYNGVMCPVTYMIDRSNRKTDDPTKAVKAVLFVREDVWVATTCRPDDIVPRVIGPDTKYMLQWKGEWRPVLGMLMMDGTPTTLAMRAYKAVLYIEGADYMVRTAVSPGEIMERYDRDPEKREWDYID